MTSSLSRSKEGESGGLLKAVSQSFSSHCTAAAQFGIHIKQHLNWHFVFVTLFFNFIFTFQILLFDIFFFSFAGFFF